MRTKKTILKEEIIYNICNDVKEAEIQSVALDFEVIRTFGLTGKIEIKKRLAKFECCISDYYMIVDEVEVFMFCKITNWFFEKGFLNKKITYVDVPFRD